MIETTTSQGLQAMNSLFFSSYFQEKDALLQNIAKFVMRHQRFLLWLSIFSFYLASAMLDVYTTNPGSRFMLTKSIAKYFRFWIDPADRDYYSSLDYAEYNGKIYSDKPPLLAVLAVPLYWVGMFLSWFMVGPQASTWEQDSIAKIVIVLGILLVNSLAMVRIYDFLTLFGYSKSTKYLTTISIAFGTLFFPYAHTFFSHDLVGSFLIFATYHIFKMKQGHSRGSTKQPNKLVHSTLAGMFLGFAMGSEYFFLFSLPLFYFLALNVEALLARKKNVIAHELASISVMTAPILACGLFILLYNWINFGDPFTTAYEYVPLFVNYQHFLNPMINGIEVLLFSNSHGLLLFTPLLFLAVIGIPFSLKRHFSLTTLTLSIFIMLVLYYSKYWKPDGGLNYGIRFLLPALPLFMINMAGLLEVLHEKNNPLKWPTYLTFAMPSFIFSLAGGWISIFPSGGEGMQNPLFGDETGEGHVSRFHRFLITLLNPHVFFGLITNRPFPGETSSTLLRQFPLIAFIVLITFTISFTLSVMVHFFQWHESKINHYKASDLNSERNNKLMRNKDDQKKNFIANVLFATLNGLYVVAFLQLHIHVLAKELSTIPNVEEKFQIYPEDLQITFLVFVLYLIIIFFLIATPKMFKSIDNLEIIGALGITYLGWRLMTFIPPLDGVFKDANNHVTIFFLILYHWGLGYFFIAFLGFFLKITKLNLTSKSLSKNGSRNHVFNVIQVVKHPQFVSGLSWLLVSLFTLFIFGRLEGITFFFTFYLYRVSLFSLPGLIWNVAVTIEMIGLMILVIAVATTLQQLSERRGVDISDARQ